jgi:general stress protein CsbA
LLKYTWIGIILGIWLIIAPFILGYAQNTTAMWNDIILGILVTAGSYALMTEERRGARIKSGEIETK